MCTISEKNNEFHLSLSSLKFSFFKRKDPVSGSLSLKLNTKLLIVESVYKLYEYETMCLSQNFI